MTHQDMPESKGPTPGPWRVSVETTPSGESVKILGANGTVIALVKAAGGAKHANARILAAVLDHAKP